LIGLAATGDEPAQHALIRYHPEDLDLSGRLSRIPRLARVALERMRAHSDPRATPILIDMLSELRHRLKDGSNAGIRRW
jgi:hypothetical protein